MSYRDFLLNVVKADSDAVAFYQARTHDEWGVGIDAVSALDVWAFGFPGFQGLHLEPGSAPHMGYTAAGYADGGSYTFHFPDGNASIARLLVRHLIPGSVPGDSAEDVVTARVDYSRLDRADASVRIRLNSIVARVRNVGDPSTRSGNTISQRRRRVRRTRAVVRARLLQYADSVSLPGDAGTAEGSAALRRQNPADLYQRGAEELASVQEAWNREGLFAGRIFFVAVLNPTVDIGKYRSPRSPDEPVLVQMVRTPVQPGLPERDQHRAGHYDVLSTSFATFEHNIRDQLTRILGAGGFDPDARYCGYHGQSLAARLCLRVQSAVRSGLAGRRRAPRNRPGAVRPHHHCKFGRRRRGLHGLRD